MDQKLDKFLCCSWRCQKIWKNRMDCHCFLAGGLATGGTLVLVWIWPKAQRRECEKFAYSLSLSLSLSLSRWMYVCVRWFIECEEYNKEIERGRERESERREKWTRECRLAAWARRRQPRHSIFWSFPIVCLASRGPLSFFWYIRVYR